MPKINNKTHAVGTEPDSQYVCQFERFSEKTINFEEFIRQYRQSPTDFIRHRKLPFSMLIFFLMNLIKGSYQDELDHFFKTSTPGNGMDLPFLP